MNLFIMKQCLSFPSFCLALFHLFLINKPVASLNAEKSSLQGESPVLISSEGKNETEMEITCLGLENVYHIVNEYTFFIPEITVECECACTSKHEAYCTDKTYQSSRDCATLINSTSTCTIYNSIGKDTSICPEYYRMCCRTFFSKTKSLNSYKALQVKYYNSILNLQIHFTSPDKEKEIIKANITAPIKYLQINMEHILQTFHLTPDRRPPDHWYYVQDESNELYFSENINELKKEKELKKLGWFYFSQKEQRLTRPSINDLNQRLTVTPSNCRTVPPKYEWTLNAEGYYSEGLLRLPKDIRKVSEMFETSVEKISVNIKEKIIKIEAKQDPTIDRDLINVASFPFMFISELSLSTKKEPLLHLIFTKGNGSISIEIINPYWKDTITFSNSVPNASMNDPVAISYAFKDHQRPFKNIEVCATQGLQQLCQSPIIIGERTTTVRAATSPSISTKISQESLTGEIYETDPNPWTLTNIMIAVTSVSTFIMLATVFVSLFKKKRKRKQLKKQNSAELENELETKSLVNSSNKDNEILPECTQINEKITALDVWNVSSKHCSTDLNVSSNDDIEDSEEHNRHGMLISKKIKQRNIASFKKGLRNRIQKKQKKEFKERTSSLEEQHIDISMKIENGKGEEEDGNKIGKEEIFKEQENGNPRRILVEDPQSKLLEELLLDWSEGVDYMNDKFDLVFVISLNDEHCETNIEKHLLGQCQEIDGTEDDKLKAIQEIEARVLLLLDGLDEASPEMKRSFLPLITKKYYPNMTVICFCKTKDICLGNEVPEPLDQMGSGEGENHINWDKQFNIKAI